MKWMLPGIQPTNKKVSGSAALPTSFEWRTFGCASCRKAFFKPWVTPTAPAAAVQVSVPFIVVVKFKGDKLSAERIYWDQATVLRQVGVLPDTTPVVTDADQARKMVDFGSITSNGLMNGESTEV
jgi:hypothetical protein